MKHLRVLRYSNNVHEVIVNKLKDSVASDCYLLATSNNFDEVLASVKFKPFFSKKYVVQIIMRGITRDQVAKLLSVKWVQCLFICTSLYEYGMLDFLKDDLVSILNNYPKKKLFSDYVEYRLPKITGEAIDEFWSRMRQNMQYLEYFVESLSALGKIDKSVVTKIVPKQISNSLDKFFINLITSSSKRDVFATLDSYRYASKFMKRFLKEKIDLLLLLHDEMVAGTFNKRTVKEWLKNNKKQRLSEYKALIYLDVLEKYSVDELLLIQEKIVKCEIDRYSVYVLVFSIFYRREIAYVL